MKLLVVLYLFRVGHLGGRGFRGTRTVTDSQLGGRKIHPYVMAISYGATFISTSAIIGFGGDAAAYGMSLMWLVRLNIFVGIFIACVFFGGRTRSMSLRLDAHLSGVLGARLSIAFYPARVRLGYIALHADLHGRSADERRAKGMFL